LNATASVWKDRHSPYDTSNLRAIAEDELLALSAQAGHIRTTALDLCGLWGGARDPRHWVSRVAPNKEALAKKGSLHMIHGEDVARAIVAVHEQPEVVNNQRWIITDGRVYDWWDLASAWAHDQEGGNDKEPYAKWVRELLREHEVRALPRTPELIGRALDGREFWEAFGLDPVRARLEKV
jgi:nucleoside-diphosphate-sugar epimerase